MIHRFSWKYLINEVVKYPGVSQLINVRIFLRDLAFYLLHSNSVVEGNATDVFSRSTVEEYLSPFNEFKY